MQALKKEANWLNFIQIKPRKDPVFEREMSKLKLRNLIDQFLLPHNSFIEINNDEVLLSSLNYLFENLYKLNFENEESF